MIQKLSHWDFSKLFCKLTNKWCVYIAFEYALEETTITEIIKAAPCLSFDTDYQLLSDGEGWIVCDTEAEAFSIYNSIVGDDGPTKTNSYNGKAIVYACVYSNRGAETENT